MTEAFGIASDIFKTNCRKSAQTDIRKAEHKKEAMKDKAEEFLDWVREHRTANTLHVYEFGLKKFLGFVGKSGTEIITDAKKRFMSEDQQDKDFWKNKILDFKNSLTKEGLTQNSARTQATGTVSFFKFYGIVITLEKDFWEVQMTLGDFVPSIEQYRQMYQTGDIRAKLLISLGLDLAWRIGDITNIKKSDLPDLAQEPPISFEKITEKEKVVGKSFLSVETTELLKAFIPTLKPENEFLFQNGNDSNIHDQTVNDILQNLAKKSGLKIPNGKILRFHCFRKRFLSTCADCGLDENLARILVGKAVDISMLTYLGEANLKNAWAKVKEQLTLTNGSIKSSMNQKDERITDLQTKVTELERLIRLMSELNGEEITKKALARLKAEGQKDVLLGPDVAKGIDLIPKEARAFELLKQLAELEKKKQDKAYEELMKNGNNHETN